MASSQDTFLKAKLLNLECHFNWELNKCNLNDLQNRLKDHIELGEDRQTGWFYSILAFTKYMQGQLEEARDNLEKAEEHIRKHHGDNTEKQLIVTYGNFAWVYYHMGNYTQSQTYLEKLDEVKKSFPTESPYALYPVIYGEKGTTFLTFSHEYLDKAKQCFEKALETEPEDISWNTGYAVALYRLESEHTSIEESPAIQQLKRALELDPSNANIMAMLGLKYAANEDLNKGNNLIETALEIQPDSRHVIQYVAKFHRQYGSMERAISLLERALEKKPNSIFLHHQLGLCYKHRRSDLWMCGGIPNNRAQAERLFRQGTHHLEKAISLNPTFIYAMLDLGKFYAEGKQFGKAEAMFERAFRIATEKNESLQEYHLRYADFQRHDKRSESLAIQHYKEGISLGKDTFDGKKCVMHLQNIADKRILKNPQDGEAFGILGFVHQIRGENQEAIECYEKAILHDHGNEEYLTALCDLRLSLQ